MQIRERSEDLRSLGIPTAATFAVLIRVLGVELTLLATVAMVVTAARVGGLLDLVPPTFSG